MSLRRDQRGFTLIEIAVALGLFAVVIVSLTLLFNRAVTSAGRSRFDELAKTLAQRKLEEVRSLPFYISQKEETGDVDLLDLYFPNTTGTSPIPGATGAYDGTPNVWTFTTTENVTEDGRNMTRATEVQFVIQQANGTLVPRQPLAGYDSDLTDVDRFAAESVKVTVTVSRVATGQPRSVSFDTVISLAQQEQPSVEASGSVLGSQVSGLSFQDGDGPGGIAAEILAEVSSAQTVFREVAGSSSQATADSVQVLEREPVAGTTIQAEAPSADQAAASVPNSSTGNTQTDTSVLPAGTYASLNGTGAIASWEASNPGPFTQSQVSALHSLNPEGHADVSSLEFRLNARDAGEATPLPMVLLGEVVGEVDERSTTTSATVIAQVDILGVDGDPAVTLWASRQFGANNAFEGVVTIHSIHVDTEATAGATAATTVVNWTVTDLRVWDPDANGGQGDYGVPYTFGFISTCGGWVGNPVLCGPLRTDGKQPFENPNPVVIPSAYVGTDAQGQPQTSLAIVAGVTVRDSNLDPVAGVANASVAQKNVLSMTTREDLAGAVPLEEMLIGVGDANVSVSFITHEH